ncbi:MAG: 3-oxoacyl-ACP reductase [Alphaproteobacteria bacterium]|nr:MAG: 3-oxoacyl-ACP reductase [Alphaproteobacteria bacterium]
MNTNQYPSLENKVVFITGGASGIGAHLVQSFCHQQAKVVFVDILDDEAKALVDRLQKQEGATTPTYYPCDLLDIDSLKKTIANVKVEIGLVSVLLNNAAVDERHDFTAITEAYWNERINLNLRHAFFAIQACQPHMKALGTGSIINFGSMSWYECQGGMTGYTTSKAGLEGMTRGLARDLGADNIRINTLVPGWVMTEKQLNQRVDVSALKTIETSQCLKTKLMPEDISAMALFLASDDSKMCTAQNFIVDAGWI